jgi:hypothetical protein
MLDEAKCSEIDRYERSNFVILWGENSFCRKNRPIFL